MATVTNLFVQANNQFGHKLFSKFLQQQPDQNIFISPLSISIALSMLYNGAVGETQAGMAIALGIQNMSVQEVNQAAAQLMQSLKNVSDIEMAIANSLWAASTLKFRANFLQRVQEFYQAEVEGLDFSNPDAAATINQWVSHQTFGKIQQIVQQLSSETILVLLNAIYFKGAWSDRFDPTETQPGIFTRLDGSQIQVPMMSQLNEYYWHQNQEFQAVRIPFKDQRINFDIFLPPTAQIKEFYQRLKSGDGENWLTQFSVKSMTKHQINLVMPRFRIEYEVQEELQDALVTLGMRQTFGEWANFEQMSSEAPHLSQIVHKIFLELDEEGTEAAATTTAIAVSGGMLSSYFTLTVDRPFFCAIRDTKTGAILFMGVILDLEPAT